MKLAKRVIKLNSDSLNSLGEMPKDGLKDKKKDKKKNVVVVEKK